MKKKLFMPLMLLSLSITVREAAAQEAAPKEAQLAADETQNINAFPINRLWQEAMGQGPVWNPEWPLWMAPDSFTPVTYGSAGSVKLQITHLPDAETAQDGAQSDDKAITPASAAIPAADAASASLDNTQNEPSLFVFTLSKNSSGFISSFPFLLNGEFYQADIEYNGEKIKKIKVLFEAVTEIEFLEYEADFPKTARIQKDGNYYFAAFKWYNDECAELWTDAAGIPLAILTTTRVLHYDSMGNTSYVSETEIQKSGQDSSVILDSTVSAKTKEDRAFYNAHGARYWMRDDKSYEFQRDSAGLILRLIETSEESQPLYYSYDYTGKSGGFWLQRNESRWTEIDGYLAPSPGDTITREIK